MALVSSIDYPNKKIYLGILSVGISLDTLDIYKEIRALRASTEGDRRYYPMIIAGGNIQKTATAYTSPYVQLLFGCEIIPYDATQTLTLVRDTFSDDGRAGAQVFNTTGFANVITLVEAVEKVEVREVATGGVSGPTAEENAAELLNTALVAHDTAGTVGALLSDLLQIETGRWKIVGNQMVIYESDGTTVLKAFDLKDSAGNPTETEPFERVPV